MKRNSLFLYLNRMRALFIGSIFLLFFCTAYGQDNLPNIILISIDTLRADHLSCYGYGRDTSSNIDALAENGVMFSNTFSHVPKTTPSHMSMMTSLHQDVHKVNMVGKGCAGSRLDKDIPTLAEILMRNGYTGAAFTGGLNVGAYRGFDRGFSLYLDKRKVKIDDAIHWLDDNHQKKFFLFFHTYIVHDPYLPPEQYTRIYDPFYKGRIIDSKEKLADLMRRQNKQWWQKHEVFWKSVNKSDPRDVTFLTAQYDAEIKYVDNEVIGRLIERLKKLGLYKNTLIIFTADHGEAFKEHDNFLHEDLYAETLHVPLIMVYPKGLPKNKTVTHLTRLTDIMPTVLEIVGIKTDFLMQGKSLVPAIEGKNLNLSCYSSYHYSKAIRNDAYTYMEDSKFKLRYLFDRQIDPAEKNNIVTANPDVADKLRKELYKEVEICNTLALKSHPTEMVKPDSLMRKRLESLGYMQ